MTEYVFSQKYDYIKVIRTEIETSILWMKFKKIMTFERISKYYLVILLGMFLGTIARMLILIWQFRG